jgi:hypothetical protein
MSEGPEGPYDPRAAARELASTQANRATRKLSFYDQCAAFYALYNRVESKYVAKAFGISPTAASQIGGCLETDPRPYTMELVTLDNGQVEEMPAYHRDMNRNRMPSRVQRYRRVAEEFNRLGEEAFADKYFPIEIRNRIRDAKRAYDTEIIHQPARRGSDPTANEGPDETRLPNGEVIRVGWLEENEKAPAGWYVIGERQLGREMLPGGAGGDPQPFQNKQAALKGAWLMNYFDPPKRIVG